MAILTFTSFVLLGEKGDRPTLVSLRTAETEQLYQGKRMIGGIGVIVVLNQFSNFKMGKIQKFLGEKWHPPECFFYKTKSGCRFGEKCSCAYRPVDEQPSKRSKKNGDKSAVAIHVEER